MEQYLTYRTYWNLKKTKIIYGLKKVRNFIIARETFLKENDTGMYITTENIYKSAVWERFIINKKNKIIKIWLLLVKMCTLTNLVIFFLDNQFVFSTIK